MFRIHQQVWVLRPGPVKGRVVDTMCGGSRVKVKVEGAGTDTYRNGDVFRTREIARTAKRNMDREATWRSW